MIKKLSWDTKSVLKSSLGTEKGRDEEILLSENNTILLQVAPELANVAETNRMHLDAAGAADILGLVVDEQTLLGRDAQATKRKEVYFLVRFPNAHSARIRNETKRRIQMTALMIALALARDVSDGSHGVALCQAEHELSHARLERRTILT